MPRSSRKSRSQGKVYGPGDPGYDDLMEQEAIERWKAAGAPTPMAMWQQSQRRPAASGEVRDDQPEWLTTAEVAERFRWKPKTVRNDIREGRLIASQAAPGRPYRVRYSDAEAWASARLAPKAAKKPQRQRSTRTQKASTSFRDLAKKAKS